MIENRAVNWRAHGGVHSSPTLAPSAGMRCTSGRSTASSPTTPSARTWNGRGSGAGNWAPAPSSTAVRVEDWPLSRSMPWVRKMRPCRELTRAEMPAPSPPAAPSWRVRRNSAGSGSGSGSAALVTMPAVGAATGDPEVSPSMGPTGVAMMVCQPVAPPAVSAVACASGAPLALGEAAWPSAGATAVANEPAPNPAYRLKAGAEGKLCLDCHPGFEENLKKAFVHTPVKVRNCAGCHNPHASNHGKFLSEEGGAVCLKCHARTVPADAKSRHKPVSAGRCTDCHDPHASANKFNLVRPGNDLCAGCHKPVAENAAKTKFKHKPVAEGCTACHAPHGSARGESLLKSGVPELCLGCHKPDRPIFQKAHLNYPVAKAQCTSCHDPPPTR